jgi:phosphoglycerol transferase MdoB-like AlkP superfamily enzyme
MLDKQKTGKLADYYRVMSPIFVFMLASLMLFSVSRLALLAWQFPRVSDVDGLGYILLQGLRFDLVTLGMVLLVPLLLTPLMSVFSVSTRLWRPVLIGYLLIVFGLFVFIEAATPSFINQYDLRPNIWFIEYLKYPQEVLATLKKAYLPQMIIGVLLTVSAMYLMYCRLRKATAQRVTLDWRLAVLSVPVVFLLCTMAIRSTLDHRPVNPSTVVFCEDPLVNMLPLNSTYTVLYAAYQLKEEQNNPRPYGDMDKLSVIDELRNSMALAQTQFVSETLPTLHLHQPVNRPARSKNLVIILMESMGAEFVGKLGGRPLTPNIDVLAEQGIWFDNLYATGTRSVRGIEAVVSGYLPTTARSVVKLPKSQHGFFTIASLLKKQGYATSFIYGGEGQFDNMAAFFSGNGFEKIIDQDDYINPAYYGSWGVPDEDVFKRAHEEFLAQHGQQPFFSLIFTASNHSPYDFPEGRIEPYEQPHATRNNAAKYTDYAVGEFIRQAQQSAYWQDTVFLIIADHNSRVYGSDLVPIEGFHIPALVVGGDIAPRKVSHLASQIDMLPTMLSLMGIEARIPAVGIDLLRADIDQVPGRAIMQFAENQAYMQGEKVVIMRPGAKPEHFNYRQKRLEPLGRIEAISPEQQDELESLQKKALAHAIWPSMAYFEGLYKDPDTQQLSTDMSASLTDKAALKAEQTQQESNPL